LRGRATVVLPVGPRGDAVRAGALERERRAAVLTAVRLRECRLRARPEALRLRADARAGEGGWGRRPCARRGEQADHHRDTRQKGERAGDTTWLHGSPHGPTHLHARSAATWRGPGSGRETE